MNCKKLLAIASLIEENKKVLDVGCDHAYLAKILQTKKVTTVSSDISKEVILKYSKIYPNQEFRLGNGLEVIKENDNFDVVVISGMGSYLIIDILSNIKDYQINELVICSHTKSYEVRKFLVNKGYIISDELIIKEHGKFYEIDKFVLGKATYNDEDILLGPINRCEKTSEYKEYISKRITKLKEILSKNKNLELEKILGMLEDNI